jgi:cytidine deaminase
MKRSKLQISYEEYENEAGLPAGDLSLLEAARKAAHNAYAPYSEFMVGAAVRLENGVVVTGNNQENAAYPSSLCAERVALFAASSQYPGVAVTALAITARSAHYSINEPVPPCGACRQVMVEYESLHKKNIRIILAGEKGRVLVLENTDGVMPFKFDGSNLRKKK